jgi:glycosyltransferase involved in cell wall biosynthesis
MKKLLFLIHDLGHGGAEKVLVNLVNNMDPEQFDITVMALFGGGVNEQFLKPHIRYQTVFKRTFPGNSHVMKLFSPRTLHKWFIKERYDIEASYLEGPSARIISGCPHKDTKLLNWIHCTMATPRDTALGFRSVNEAAAGYNEMDTMVFVSETARDIFLKNCAYTGKTAVLYNTNESDQILQKAVEEAKLSDEEFCWCGVGKLANVKGYDRMIRIQKRLTDEGYNTHFYALGEGPQRNALEAMVKDLGCEESVTFLGYQTNPYKYVAKCDLFVCASHAEGFSTAATEALIVGTPVCTVEVSGMKEMLGSHNEYGIVTENDDEALYQGIKKLLDNPELLEHYRHQAALRGKDFRTEETVKAVEQMLLAL